MEYKYIMQINRQLHSIFISHIYSYIFLKKYLSIADMLPHHHITYKNIILPSVLCNFSQAQYKLPDDGRRPKHVGAIFLCILM
jgi:hypothetical protein